MTAVHAAAALTDRIADRAGALAAIAALVVLFLLAAWVAHRRRQAAQLRDDIERHSHERGEA